MWTPGCSGGGKRPWFVYNDDSSIETLAGKYHTSSRGIIVRYGSCEAARKVAHKLNDDPSKKGK